jgi:phosphoglycerate dehydrogenase-like enzyme
MKVLLNAALGKAQLQKRLADKLAGQEIWVEDADAAIKELRSADVLICPDHFYSAKVADAVRTSAPNLRWIQLLSAGYDHAQRHGIPERVTLCNAGPAYAPGVATHAVTLLLAMQRRLTTVLANQPRHAWDRTVNVQLTTPASSTIVVIGFGPIGREIGRLLHAFGARVVAVTRRGLPDEDADEVVRVDDLLGLLPRADAIVIAAPYNQATHHLMGEREFAACKKTAVLVNIARGAIVEQHALDTALRSGAISGAGIDVTDPEPLPSDDPLWDAPNLIITPHCGGSCGPIGGERLADLVCDNLSRFLGGTPLRHVVTI